jgi:hypothetical protein
VLVRRARFTLVSWWTLVPLMRSARSTGLTEIWVGDSHAMCFNGPRTPARVSRCDDGQFVLYLGPRLMFSLARDGFPFWTRALARMIGVIAPPGSVLFAFCAGEIDVRCHLVPRSHRHDDVLAFVDPYLERCAALASSAGTGTALVVTPPPPSITCPVQPEFPVNGTIGERVDMRNRLVDRLRQGVGHVETLTFSVIDPGLALSDADGGLDAAYTDDGCHTNAAGVLVTRRIISQRTGIGLADDRPRPDPTTRARTGRPTDSQSPSTSR